MARKKEREGGRRHVSRPPFATERDALAFAQQEQMRVVEHVEHARGARLNCVREDGRPVTLRVTTEQ